VNLLCPSPSLDLGVTHSSFCGWAPKFSGSLVPKIHYTRFPVSSPLTGKSATCCRFVSDLLAILQTILTCQDVANKSATSRCNGTWETNDITDTTDFCPRQLVTDLLRTSYGETGAMDFGLSPLEPKNMAQVSSNSSKALTL